MSVLTRKRVISPSDSPNKKQNTMSDDQFSEKMYTTYVKSALLSLETDALPINTITDKINLPIGHPESITLPNSRSS